MKEGLIKNIYEHIMKEIQSFITLLYIFMIGFGMLFNYQKYSEFDINIFEYADIFDFLIAPFQDYRIVLFSLISLIIPITVVILNGYWKKRFPKWYSLVNFGLDKKSWYKNFSMISFSFLFLAYIFLSADIYGKENKKSTNLKEETTITFVDNQFKKGILIGKTKEYLFLKTKTKVTAIPIASTVKEIEIK